MMQSRFEYEAAKMRLKKCLDEASKAYLGSRLINCQKGKKFLLSA